jgi:cytochrome c biogenesis protein CcdA
MEPVSLAKITSLAFADAVNPCVIAILAIVLITILIQNPEKRKRVLYAGLAFVGAVYIGYLIYGFIIIQIFKTFSERIETFSFYLYRGLAIFAMLLGALNVKDYFMYRPGGILTEMPMFLRPHARLLVKRMTSPSGAFFIGVFVTIFLLPCTIGPYVIASGMLAEIGFAKAFLWLLYYNLIFVIPMLIIVGLVYFGYTEIEDVSGWKERNIKRLHLIAGLLLFFVGLSLLMGWL